VAQPVRIVDGAVPKHEQLRAILTELATRELAPGDMLPSERQLCQDHGVSRITVREAIGQLVSEGLLIRVRGKGTFVADRAVRSRLHLASFQEDMRRLGREPTTVLLSAGRGEPPARTAELFAPSGTSKGYHVRRLRVADGIPMAVDDAWYSAALAPGLIDMDLATRSIYRTLTEHYGRSLDRAEQTVGAVGASREIAALLGLPVSRPVLVFDRVTFSGDLVIEHARSWYRGDRYELQMTLEGAAPR
jgi:GntR family transcriptional regulator